MRQTLIDKYLDYVNNYITVSKFAEHNGISEQLANMVINEGRELYQLTNGVY